MNKRCILGVLLQSPRVHTLENAWWYLLRIQEHSGKRALGLVITSSYHHKLAQLEYLGELIAHAKDKKEQVVSDSRVCLKTNALRTV